MATLSPPTSPPRDYPTRESFTRPRTTSALSHVSGRSRRSSNSGNKVYLDLLTETSHEKQRLHTKANPNKALNELQPAAVAQQESNLEDLRITQHKDAEGNVITDPDRSNPTRYRLERPLDTIRSFQAAAEGTSSSRRSPSYSRPASQVGFDGGYGRRSTYHESRGWSSSPQRSRSGMGGYYKNGSYGFRPDSFAEESPNPGQYYTSQPPQNRGFPQRQTSNMSYYNQTAEAPSPAHSHQHSYETMTSGSDDMNSKSTNPSSLNSSFDQLHQLRKPEPTTNEYDSEFSPAHAPVHAGSTYNNTASPYYGSNPTASMNGHSNYNQMQPRAPVPALNNVAAPNNPRVPIKLNSTPNTYPTDEDFGIKKTNSTKRQSWIKKTFGRRKS